MRQSAENARVRRETLRLLVELAATAAFALSGIMEGARKRLDAVGVCVVGFLTAFGGGTLRDLLLDQRPFFWVRHVEMLWGVLALCVLALLSHADSYAYEIASRLTRDIDMGEGTIYPLMRRMQSDGLVETYLVESQSGPPRKYYRLTAQGRRSLEQQKTEWVAFTQAVNAIVGAAA